MKRYTMALFSQCQFNSVFNLYWHGFLAQRWRWFFCYLKEQSIKQKKKSKSIDFPFFFVRLCASTALSLGGRTTKEECILIQTIPLTPPGIPDNTTKVSAYIRFTATQPPSCSEKDGFKALFGCHGVCVCVCVLVFFPVNTYSAYDRFTEGER